MKKITLKITTLVLLTMFAFQGYAQFGVTSIVEGTKYTLKNVATGDFLRANGTGAYEFVGATSPNDVNLNFFFNHHNTVDPADGTVHNYLDDWNLGNDTRGIMRSANTGTVHTNFKFDIWNSNGGHKTDKRWVETYLMQGPFNTFRIGAVVSGTDVRFLYQGIDGLLYNYVVADMNDAANTNTDGEARSYWILEESTIVLSNDEFDASSIFISNPVSNELIVKGLTDNVSSISIYSLIGKEVLTNNVDAQSSVNIDVTSLASGLYIVKLSGVNGSITRKIIKQ
jgi:hypothetical protein